MTCPGCGARNPSSSTWCSQCLRPLGTASTPPTRASSGPAPPPTDRAFRTVDGEVEWRCPDCATWNLFLVPVCATCGHRLGDDDGRSERARRVLWVVAAVVGVVVVVSVVLAVLALRGAPTAPGAVAVGGLASTATSCPPATCGDP